MRFLIFSVSVVLLLEVIGDTGFQQSAVRGATALAPQRTGLELSYRIVERKYCTAGGMLLILASEYKNIGEHNLILFKHALAPFEYRISRSVEAAKAKRYEQVVSPMLGSASGLTQFSDEPSRDYFVILEPGESFAPANTITVPMFTAGANQKRSKNYLDPGKHVLELKSLTWPFHGNNKLEAELQIRWERFGTLWTKPILSLPTAFEIERLNERSLSDCNAPVQPLETKSDGQARRAAPGN